MKINEIIRIKRLEKGCTQEQIASLLGVSAPAVNKWEKAVSYPDITLLPALARLLDTDLNTLLSFQDDLTIEEVHSFLNELISAADTKGIDCAFAMASDKLYEYPSCDILLLNTALTLESLILTDKDKNPEYMDSIQEMYERASKSCDSQVSSHAKAMLISKYIGKKEFDTAGRLLDELPEATISKKQLQSTLYLKQGKWDQAAQLIEGKILSAISEVQSSLLTLVEIAAEESRLSDARQLTDIAKQTASLFDLWKYNIHIADFQLAVVQKDTSGCLEALKQMLPALEQGWKPAHSPLYKHLSFKETTVGQRFLTGILNDLEDPDNHMYDFLREDAEIQELLQTYHSSTK